MSETRDEFLSEEDLDLVNMSQQELEAWWNAWLEQSQTTNEDDKNEYSHGVFVDFRFDGGIPWEAGRIDR
jgi:hypothetical protein